MTRTTAAAGLLLIAALLLMRRPADGRTAVAGDGRPVPTRRPSCVAIRVAIRMVATLSPAAARHRFLAAPPAGPRGGVALTLLDGGGWTASVVTGAAAALTARRGGPDGAVPAALGGLRLATGLAAAVAGGPIAVAVIGPLPGLAATLAIAGLGTRLPDATLARADRRARTAALDSLPDTVDLVAAALGAGRSLEWALALAARQADPPLSAVLTRVTRRAGRGQDPAAALADEAEQAGLSRLVSIASTVRRQRALGLPVAQPLRRHADAARQEAAIAAMSRAGRAVSMAGLLTALVVAPASVAALASLLLGGLLHTGGAVPI